MEKDLLNIITDATNRSVNQTNFLLNILEGDINKLLELEWRIKNLHIFYVPGSIEDCNDIFEMAKPESEFWPKPNLIILKSKKKKWHKLKSNLISICGMNL